MVGIKRKNKLVLIMHVGNMKVFKELLSDYPRFFNNENIDIYFSCNTIEDNVILKKMFPNEKVFLYKNKGMDIGPFLLTINDFIKRNINYDYYIKIHTKSDKTWRDILIKPIYDKLNYFLTEKEDTIKIYGASEYTLVSQFSINYPHVLGIINRNFPEYIVQFLNYCSTNNTNNCNSNHPEWIAGTIFVFNDEYFDLLKNIKDINYEYSILEEGHVFNEKSRANHSWEYLLGYLSNLNNQEVIKL
jgi:hypothetical protein